jgi:sterol desaturase/sphingolipid hydroxylase (fatty acid hydroxylase superfamily)
MRRWSSLGGGARVKIFDLQSILIIALIFIPLERVLPLHAEQKVLRKYWLNDVVYLFVNGIVIKIGLLILIAPIIVGIRLVIPEGLTLAVQSQPLWLQAVEVILIADVGFYLAHRAFHTVPFLWKFHAIHHSIEEMDWLAAHRVHPVDPILTMTASLLPIYAVDFSAGAVAIYVVIYQGQSLLIHSNTRIAFGPLKWLFASPQFHHWHHANERQAYDKNFAAQLPFLDAIAGTFYMPQRMPKTYGTDEPVPPLYHQQLAYPLHSRRGQSAAPAVASQHSGDPNS